MQEVMCYTAMQVLMEVISSIYVLIIVLHLIQM